MTDLLSLSGCPLVTLKSLTANAFASPDSPGTSERVALDLPPWGARKPVYCRGQSEGWGPRIMSTSRTPSSTLVVPSAMNPCFR